MWLEDTVATIRARDPYHSITIVLNCVENPYRTVSDYSIYADIVMADPYPIGLRNPVCLRSRTMPHLMVDPRAVNSLAS